METDKNTSDKANKEGENPDIITQILTNTNGLLLDVKLESKTDGTTYNVLGTNHFLDKVPHIESDNGTIYPFARFSIRSFN